LEEPGSVGVCGMLLDAEARRHGETRGEKTFEMNEAASTAV